MRRFAEIDSTNSYLLSEARAGAEEGVVAVTDVQRAGHGRLQRAWEAPSGTSLLVSVLLRPDLPVERFHLAVACMALAAADACAEVSGVRPGLKWPNDLVIGPEDGKLGGILAESEFPAVVVGLGLNVDWPAGMLPAGAAALGAVDRDELLTGLLAHLETRYGNWSRVSEEYRAACVTVGRRVRVELGDEILTGTVVAISEEGHLVVAATSAGRESGLRRTITAGDVIHVRADVSDWSHSSSGEPLEKSGIDVPGYEVGEGG